MHVYVIVLFKLKDDPEISRSELEKKRGDAYKAALEVPELVRTDGMIIFLYLVNNRPKH